jgi:endogenous inhibitor of DNA gyrase (YacG/DUF329 family)
VVDAHPGYRCPTCDDWVPPGAPSRPFCGERCRTTDLGDWLAGRYRIPARDDDEDTVAPPPPPQGTDDDDAP